MPPKPSLTGSFNVADAGNEVVCPLQNNDGSACRKRCFGEKRYRSMQEHIRRAHPDYYISKLPATEESFLLMVHTPPSQRPPQPNDANSNPNHQPHSAFNPLPYVESYLTNHAGSPGFMQDPGFYDQNNTSPQMFSHEARRPSFVPTANAAAALAQLHNSRPDDWDVDRDTFSDPTQDQNFPNYFANPDSNIFSETHPGLNESKEGSLIPPGFGPRSRGASLQPPIPRQRPNRARKSSVTENARKGKHERQKSKEQKRISGDRKTMSAEPGSLVHGKRWEDLLDAAASATEEDSRDLTPIPASPRASVPPFHGQNNNNNNNNNQFQSYNTSPLQNTILPHSPEHEATFEPPALDAFPSVEPTVVEQPSYQTSYQHGHNSSADSSISNPFNYARPAHQQQSSTGSNFHIPAAGLSSSPNEMPSATAYARQHGHAHSWSAPHYDSQARGVTQQAPPSPVQHYCAACHRITPLNSSYACTECICGICRDCVDVLVNMPPDRGPRCPRCNQHSRFKPFMLDLR